MWSDIIAWLHFGLIEAEELGVTAGNADEMAKSAMPAIQRLLGSTGDLGSRLGLDNKWMLQAIKAGGKVQSKTISLARGKGEAKFEVEGGGSFTVFTTRPDTLFGCTYAVLAPEHALVDTITTAERRA